MLETISTQYLLFFWRICALKCFSSFLFSDFVCVWETCKFLCVTSANTCHMSMWQSEDSLTSIITFHFVSEKISLLFTIPDSSVAGRWPSGAIHASLSCLILGSHVGSAVHDFRLTRGIQTRVLTFMLQALYPPTHLPKYFFNFEVENLSHLKIDVLLYRSIKQVLDYIWF